MQDQIPSRDEIRQLIEARDGLRVSILMPGHVGDEQVIQNPIRLKNLLHRAEEQLVELGLKPQDARRQLGEAWSWLGSEPLLKQQSRGLAVYIDGERTLRFRLPIALEEMVVVSEHFHVAPLLPLVQEDSRCFVLTLSGKRVRLIECTRQEAHEVEVPRMMRSFEEYGRYIDGQAERQWHTEAQPTQSQSGMPGTSERSAVFFGGGAGADDAKRWQVDYCHLIESAVTRFLNPTGVSLLLAGTEPLLSIYREANGYPLLLPEVVEGNFDHCDDRQVHSAAWPVIDERLESQVARDITGVQRALESGAKIAVTSPEEVLPASLDGRVGVLLCAKDDHVWGRFEEGERRVEEHDRRRPGDEDLVNVAAVLSAKAGSVIHAVERNRIPGRSAMAALLRY